jgi:hypothetical protein
MQNLQFMLLGLKIHYTFLVRRYQSVQDLVNHFLHLVLQKLVFRSRLGILDMTPFPKGTQSVTPFVQ